MEFDVGVSTADKTIRYELFMAHLTKPLVLHLRYAGAANKQFQALVRTKGAKYRRQIQQDQTAAVELARALWRKTFPGRIVTRCEDVPVKGGDTVELTDTEDIANLLAQMADEYFDQVTEAALDLNNFTEREILTEDEAQEVAAEMGEESGPY